MSTVAEIEAALGKLTPGDLQRVEETLRRLQRQRAGDSHDIASVEHRNGFEVFPERAGAVATVENVRQLCAEEGI